jgi:hypothetical protein
MAAKNNTNLQKLKTLISDRFNQLDRKLDETKAKRISFADETEVNAKALAPRRP